MISCYDGSKDEPGLCNSVKVCVSVRNLLA